jgi:hypothetical protein
MTPTIIKHYHVSTNYSSLNQKNHVIQREKELNQRIAELLKEKKALIDQLSQEKLKNKFNFDAQIKIFLNAVETLKNDVDVLSKNHYKNISLIELTKVQEKYNVLKRWVEKALKNGPILDQISKLNRKTSEKWNNSILNLLLINFFLEYLGLLRNIIDPIKNISHLLDILNLEARNSLKEFCKNNQTDKPDFKDLKARLEKLDEQFRSIIFKKRELYKSIKEKMERKTVEEAPAEFLESESTYDLTSSSSREKIVNELTKKLAEMKGERKKIENELLMNRDHIAEMLSNTGRQLDKFVDAYQNNGQPYYKASSGNSYACSENYKQLCEQENPDVTVSYVNKFLYPKG